MASLRLLKEVMDSLPVAVVAVDSRDRVVLWNKASQTLFGWRSFEVVGKAVPVVPVDRWDEFRAFTEIARGGKSLQVMTRRQRKDGAPIEVKVTVIPVHNRSGQVKYVVGMHELVGETLLDMAAHALHSAEGVRPLRRKPGASRVAAVLRRFTPRQRQIIRLVASGQKNESIARRLLVNEQVIKNYLSAIYRELRIHSRTELTVWFNQQTRSE